MKLFKFIYLLCVLFCVYCLYTLVADSYEVVYKKSNVTERFQFLACVQLTDLYPNRTEVDLKSLRGDLYVHFNRSIDWSRREEHEMILNRTESGGYLVLNRRICLIAKNPKEVKDIKYFLGSRKFVEMVFLIKSDTFEFIRLENSPDHIEQKIVLKKGRPYSECSEINSKFRCLNECFKMRFRLARYFYESNETGAIQLNFSDNETIQENERNCFEHCKRENCKLVQLNSVIRSRQPKALEAQPVLSALDFWVQIIGVIFSFVGLFFDLFASVTIQFTKSEVRQKKVRVGLFHLNLAILLLNLAYCGYLCVQVALDQQADSLPEREKTRSLVQPKIVHLAICVVIREYVGLAYEEKTLLDIETATDRALDDTLEGIYMSDGGRSFRIDYQVHHRKILFRIMNTNLRRCFPLSIRPVYRTISSNPKLTIKYKDSIPSVYVLSEEGNLNDKSFEYDSFAFQKRIVKRLKSKGCADYKYSNCTGRQNCLDRCMARKFMDRFNRTTFGRYPDDHPVIDRDWFSSFEWNTSHPMELNDSIILNHVRSECGKEIPDAKACNDTEFEETVRIINRDVRINEIDLQFDVVRLVEELPSSHQMALDLLSIQSIFFGFTLLKLFWVVYQFRKPKWRLRHDKTVWSLVCLLCSLGCSWNTIRMLDVIVNGELVPTEHYEMAERVQMPAMLFCLRIDEKLIDRNHQLTGGYLEEMTANITKESTFKSITYLNESNAWTPFDFDLIERFFLLNMKCFRVDIDQGYDRNQFHFLDDRLVLKVNFGEMEDARSRFVHFMTQSRETGESSRLLTMKLWENYGYGVVVKPKCRVDHELSLYEHKDRFRFFRRHFLSPQEDDVSGLHKHLLELQGNKHELRTLKLPMKEQHFDWEVNEDLFEQLYSVQMRKNRGNYRQLSANYRQAFMANHLRKTYSDSESDFIFGLLFLQKVVHSTNEVNYATLTLSLLNLLSIWFDLAVLDLHPFLVRLHECFLVYLYLHLPVLLLRMLFKALLFCYKWLKKCEPQLYDLLDPEQKEEQEEESPEDPSIPDQSPVASEVA